jgi:hypothetical protein
MLLCGADGLAVCPFTLSKTSAYPSNAGIDDRATMIKRGLCAEEDSQFYREEMTKCLNMVHFIQTSLLFAIVFDN